MLKNEQNKNILKEFFSSSLFNSIDKHTKVFFHKNTTAVPDTLYTFSLSLKFANMFTSYDHPLNLSSSLINLKRRIAIMLLGDFKKGFNRYTIVNIHDTHPVWIRDVQEDRKDRENFTVTEYLQWPKCNVTHTRC